MPAASLQPLNLLPLQQVYDRTFKGPESELSVRIYEPQGASPFPLLFHFFGGEQALLPNSAARCIMSLSSSTVSGGSK